MGEEKAWGTPFTFPYYDKCRNTKGVPKDTMVNKYAYDAFGAVTNQVEAIPQPFKYVGQFGVMSEPNGFYYMKARYYDPSVGRFISEDPIGFAGGDVNLMAYVGNQPINYTDPTGLLRFTVLGQTVDIQLSASFLSLNVAWDMNGLRSNNLSYNGILPPLTAGAGLDIMINPPSSNDKFVQPYVGIGKNLSIGTNLVSQSSEPLDVKPQGLNLSIGASIGVPVGVQVPNAYSRTCGK